MKGVIVINGYYQSEAYSHQISRLLEEFDKQGKRLNMLINNEPNRVGSTFDFDFAVFLDKDVAFAKIMENDGVRVFNCSFAIENTDSKIKTALVLDKYSVNMPTTIAAPVQYKYALDKGYLNKVGATLGYPLVVKTAQGSLGTGVYLANNQEELYRIDQSLKNADKLYQKYIECSSGKSYRVIVIGNEVKAAMLLENSSDFRSNANLGGRAKGVKLSKEYTRLAENVSKYLALDYCGIDFFVGNEMLLEVNSNAFFSKAEEVTKVNIAKQYTSYILRTMGEITNECN